MGDREKRDSYPKDQIVELLNQQQATKFREQFLMLHVYEQALIFVDLDEKQRARAYRYLTPAELADTFNAIEEEPEDVAEYFKEMSTKYAAGVISEMYTDNAVDILAYVDSVSLNKYLRLLPREDAAEIKEMLHYEDKTAGAIMATEFVKIIVNQTARSALHVLKKAAVDAETIYYSYVVDADDKLIGVVTLRDLLISDDDLLIEEIMNDQVMSVKVDDDQEDVAKTIRDYNFLAIPVTDYDEKMIGIITVDDIIDVIDEESAEDYSGLAGVDTEESSNNPFKSASKRLPWLVTLLFLGMSTATLISHYEQLVSEASILAVFISSITGTAGNAGTQSLAVAVRKLASKDDEEGLVRTIITELLTGLIIGVTTGLTIFIIVGIWKNNFVLGFVIGLAMMCAIVVANLAGSIIPMAMDKMGFDPAVASGPFISTLSDLTSVLIYFNIASLFLSFIVGK
ncbi:MAG: magnesium transporter [Liquorilactobacillus hordei]|uniref:Magnesium transporter MgtE n=2 Tax=Liquorilactobacillus hordei TaxID=468911 RepID=A0A0R1MID0_9LACO|nr:magnesium transporter [Liquorilactobacillus hordei]AUJ29312.1 magnesium transporter [Liquorilactobacillus hordei]KRL07775.1 Mg2+ transporter [Liquorilactobacillus hordei DSM 19519]MBZ2405437.1 magnesium transporter [Liquorilactobacillus hordei]QYH52032.1 magnesium transporter [Liquorilactobacillus hordei DSM 19519]